MLRIELRTLADDVVDVQKSRPRETELDECRLHAGQHARDPPLVDVAHEAAATRALDEHLLQHPALEQRGARLAGCDVDEDFRAHAPECHTPTPAATSKTAVSASGKPMTPE